MKIFPQNVVKLKVRDMKMIGTFESLRRYPVKTMSGEALPEAFAGFSGLTKRNL